MTISRRGTDMDDTEEPVGSAEELTARLSNSHKRALMTGQALWDAKNTQPHGEWQTWFKAQHYLFSLRTAERYITVWLRWLACSGVETRPPHGNLGTTRPKYLLLPDGVGRVLIPHDERKANHGAKR